ncbi:hypothetical protein B0A48_04550 [Cryoendolithus antarcticus]|uniref:Heterokaryon incompatibility domain-containing protein n=1 Tax=Cryoendolithus antarcticus TaxID=1507870 RepID=A0A1V8TFP7_9PEZI|nr:hypothetical protein B0A48_04550 [Cryoendolithus antarcticus]
MRLYNIDTLKFEVFNSYLQTPPYIIASHRYASDGGEITYQDVLTRRSGESITSMLYGSQIRKVEKAGFRKLDGFVAYIKQRHPGIKWLWIDTCCIDRAQSVELSEAINSMFKWYKKAHLCLAYLADVGNSSLHPGPYPRTALAKQFQTSEWFKRGWTLQELIAPASVVFLSADWQIIGAKGRTNATLPALDNQISEITGIPVAALVDPTRLSSFTAETKLKWAAGRCTTREEDMWYCLFGLLDAPIGPIYGEGAEHAQKRLLREVFSKAQR